MQGSVIWPIYQLVKSTFFFILQWLYTCLRWSPVSTFSLTSDRPRSVWETSNRHGHVGDENEPHLSLDRKRSQIWARSRETAHHVKQQRACSLVNIKDFYFWLTSYFVNIYPLGMQSSQNIASGMWSMSIHYCFSWISNDIFERNTSVKKACWSLETERRYLLCCAVCLRLVNCRWSDIQCAQNGQEANCFPLPPDDQALCFSCICISFCFSLESSTFQRSQHCVILLGLC